MTGGGGGGGGAGFEGRQQAEQHINNTDVLLALLNQNKQLEGLICTFELEQLCRSEVYSLMVI